MKMDKSSPEYRALWEKAGDALVDVARHGGCSDAGLQHLVEAARATIEPTVGQPNVVESIIGTDRRTRKAAADLREALGIQEGETLAEDRSEREWVRTRCFGSDGTFPVPGDAA